MNSEKSASLFLFLRTMEEKTYFSMPQNFITDCFLMIFLEFSIPLIQQRKGIL